MPDRAYLYSKNGEYRWRRQAANGERVAASTEGYGSKRDAVANYERVSGPEAPLLEDLTSEPDPTDEEANPHGG